MNIKELVSKIKTYLSEEILSTDYKTKDGQIIHIEDPELVEGIVLYITDETGITPAPDGEYITEDNKKITVSGGEGIIEKIEDVVTEEPVETPETPVETPVEEVPVEEMGSSMEDRVKKLEEENLQIKDLLEKLSTSLSKQVFKTELKTELKTEKEILSTKINKNDEKTVKNSVMNSNVSNFLNRLYTK